MPKRHLDADLLAECGPLIVFGLQYPNAIPGLRYLRQNNESWKARLPNFDFTFEDMVFTFQHYSQRLPYFLATRCGAVLDLFYQLNCNPLEFVETTLRIICVSMPFAKQLSFLESVVALIQDHVGEQQSNGCMIAECICRTMNQTVLPLSDASFFALVKTRDMIYDSDDATWFKIKSRRLPPDLQEDEPTPEPKGEASPEVDVWEGVPQEIVSFPRTPTNVQRPRHREQYVANRTLFESSCGENDADYDAVVHDSHAIYHNHAENSADDADCYGSHESYDTQEESLLTLSPLLAPST